MVAIYGGNWVADVNGVDFSNDAGITAKRVYDFNGPDEIVHVLTGNQDDVDQTWTDGTVTVSAQVKWADHDQSFGWNGGGLGTSYNVLLTDADLNGDSVPIEITGDFLWGTEPTHDAIT